MQRKDSLAVRVIAGILSIVCWTVATNSASAQHPLARANQLETQGVQAAERGDYQRAAALAREVLAIRLQHRGRKHDDTGLAMIYLGRALTYSGPYDEAEKYLNDARKIFLANNSRELLYLALNDLGILHREAGARDTALRFAEQALKTATAVYPAQHFEIATASQNVGVLLADRGDYKRAVELLREACGISDNRLGRNHETTALAHNNLGNTLREWGQFGEAKQELEIALASLPKGKHPLSEASIRTNLGMTCQALGDYDTARKELESALRIFQQVLGPGSASAALGHNNLGQLHSELGEYRDARQHLEAALRIRESVPGTRDAGTARSQNNLGMLLHKMGDLKKAQDLFEKARSTLEAVHPAGHKEIGIAVNNLALVYDDLGEVERCEQANRDALEIKRESVGDDHIVTIQQRLNLGHVLWRSGKTDEAETQFRAARQFADRAFADNHSIISKCLESQALVHRHRGEMREADRCLQQRLRINWATYGEYHGRTLESLVDIAGLRLEAGDEATSVKLFNVARRAKNVYLSHVFPGLSPEEQTRFLKWNYETGLHRALSLAVVAPEDDRVVAASANWLANGKGAGHWALAQRALLDRTSDNPQLAALLRQKKELTRQLARRSMGRTQYDQQRSAFDELRQQLDEIDRRLASSADAQHFLRPWTETAQIQESLGDNACLIDIARITVYDETKTVDGDPWGEDRYLAWITGSADAPVVVDLGPADAIDAAVASVRKQVEPAGVLTSLRDDGEKVAVAEFRKAAGKAAQRVLHPLLERIAGVSAIKRLIISADSDLWGLPWAALPIPGEDRFLVEAYELAFVLSGSDLVRADSKTRPTVPAIFADPDFDLDLVAKQRSLRTLLGRAPQAVDRVERRLPHVGRLPGTANEAELIRGPLERLGGRPRVFTDASALELVAKQLRSPRVAAFATHGFFLPNQRVELPPNGSASRSIPKTQSGEVFQHPFYRCGLLLAGCNDANAVVEGDDGVLTGVEVVDMDLRGTELVVLSACDTAVGEVRNGDGVVGLRQAFQLAGAAQVMATLWPIADKETAKLMADFFERLAEGNDSIASLRAAQLAMIQDRRDRHGASHPYFWSSLVLTGNPKRSTSLSDLSD